MKEDAGISYTLLLDSLCYCWWGLRSKERGRLYQLPHYHHQNDFCIISHFNVSFCEGTVKDSVHKSQLLKRKEAEVESNWDTVGACFVTTAYFVRVTKHVTSVALPVHFVTLARFATMWWKTCQKVNSLHTLSPLHQIITICVWITKWKSVHSSVLMYKNKWQL